MHPPGRPNITSTCSISSALMRACAPVILVIWVRLLARGKCAEKSNDLPLWEVVAHAAGEAGALVDEYYEGAELGTHRRRVCQNAVSRATPVQRASAARTAGIVSVR